MKTFDLLFRSLLSPIFLLIVLKNSAWNYRHHLAMIMILNVTMLFGDTLVVDNSLIDSKNCEDTGTSYATIQNAIDATSDGDTIKICKGDYNEVVTISGKKDLIITNAQDAPNPVDINWYADTTVLTIGTSNHKSENITVKNLSMHLTSTSANERVIRLFKGKDFTIDNVKLVSDGGSAIYGESGNFDGKDTFTNLTITSKGSGIRINKGNKQIFSDINMTLIGSSANDDGIYLGDQVGNDDHQFTNLNFSTKSQSAIWVKKGKNMTFNNIKINATDYSDNSDAIVSQSNVSGDADLEFKNIDISINKGIGLDIYKAKNTKYTNITIKGSTNEAIYIRDNVTGKPEFHNINIQANANYGIYIKKGKDVYIGDANISGITANGFVIRLDSNVVGKHKFERIIASTDAEGIFVSKGSGVTFDTVKIIGTNTSSNDHGIRTEQNVEGTITVKNCDINVSGYALWIEKGKPDVDNSKFVSRGDKVINFTGNTLDIKMKNSCSYKESSSGNAYAFYIGNGKTNADIKNNCFFGTPLGNLASANKTGNNVRENYWDGLSASSYDYNNIVDNSPLPSCSNTCASLVHSGSNTYLTGTFDAWDTFRDNNIVPPVDRNISTKIVNKAFQLSLASLNKDNNAYEVKKGVGSVDVAIYPKGSNNAISNSVTFDINSTSHIPVSDNFTVTSANKEAVVGFKMCVTYEEDDTAKKLYHLYHASSCNGFNESSKSNSDNDLTNKLEDEFKSNSDNDSDNDSKSNSDNTSNEHSNYNSILYDCNTVTSGIPTWHICYSSDSFAIRPDKFEITGLSGNVIKAQDINITYNALNWNSVTHSAGYNEPSTSLDFNTTLKDLSKLCQNNKLNISMNGNFIDGELVAETTFANVGEWNIILSEKDGSEFAKIDNDDTNATQRFISPADINLTIIPEHFDIALKSTINHGNNFTYISNDLDNMGIVYDLNVTAKNSNNAVTPNFSASCYAESINFNLDFAIANPQPTKLPTTILYKEMNSANNSSNQLTDGNATLQSLPNTLFTSDNNGTAPLAVRINFDREINRSLNPFRVNFSGLEISDTNHNPVVAKNNSLPSNERNVTMVYGRANAGKQRYKDPLSGAINHNANMYYEIYCFPLGECNTALLPSQLHTSDIRWYNNTLHDSSKDGNITIIKHVDGTNVAGDIVTATDTPTGNPLISILKYNGSLGYPYMSTMEVNASRWLIYNEDNVNATKNYFQVEFNKEANGWVGKHETDAQTNTTGTVKTNGRSMW